MLLAKEGEVRRLADGLHDQIDIERKLTTGDGDRATPARMIGLAQLHAHAFQRSHVPLLVTQNANRGYQELDGNTLVLGFLNLLGQCGHLSAGAAVEDADIIHAQAP